MIAMLDFVGQLDQSLRLFFLVLFFLEHYTWTLNVTALHFLPMNNEQYSLLHSFTQWSLGMPTMSVKLRFNILSITMWMVLGNKEKRWTVLNRWLSSTKYTYQWGIAVSSTIGCILYCKPISDALSITLSRLPLDIGMLCESYLTADKLGTLNKWIHISVEYWMN